MSKAHAVLGVIPARAHSTRFPFKIIAPIHGRPMIQYVWEAAKKARGLDHLVVATDHAQIYDVVKNFGGEVVMTPDTFESGTDRVAFVAKDFGAEFIVNLQGDEPLLRPENIDGLVESLRTSTQAGMATLAVKMQHSEELSNPNVVKVVFSAQGQALYFSRAPLRMDADGGFYKHIGVYAYRREVLLKLAHLPKSNLEIIERLEQLRALENEIGIQIFVVQNDTVAVDAPEDIFKVEKLISKQMEGS